MKFNYVRLHDAVIVTQSQKIKQTSFGLVEFGVKEIITPKINPDSEETFYYQSDDGKIKTPEHFYEKGRSFKDFTKYEKEFIEQFIKENNEI